MLYTFSSAHLAAIREAHNNLRTLRHLVPVLDKDGEPYYSGGASSVVFKMKDEQTGKCYALKCFTEEQEGRAEAYRLIEEELKFVDSPHITSVKYLEKELFVDSDSEDNEHSVLLMDWIEGKTMEAYINAYFMDGHAMAMLYYQFCKMVDWLRSQSFAHGDIRLDNIIVRPNGTLTLVDYDDMFLPAMKGRKSPTISTKNLPHPLRTIDDFGETTDDFALVSIALSLKAISLDSSLLQNYGASDRLLFAPFEYFDLSMRNNFAPLQDLLNAAEDEFGVKYSKDWKRLLKAPQNLEGEYSIREGAKVIEKEAFSECNSLKSVIIPNSVTIIEDWAFLGCCSLRSIDIPDSVTKIGVSAFSGCSSLMSIHMPDSVTSIGYNAFEGCISLKNIRIPDSVTSIGSNAFEECVSLKSIIIPDSVTRIEGWTFYYCKSLESIIIPDSVTSIGDSAFSQCI
ncbi:MAG: leucine-rich repeat protein [Prevotella sp.]